MDTTEKTTRKKLEELHDDFMGEKPDELTDMEIVVRLLEFLIEKLDGHTHSIV